MKMKEGESKRMFGAESPSEALSLIKQELPEIVEELAERGVGVELDTEGLVAVARKGARRASFKMEGTEAVIEYKVGDTVRARIVNPRSSEFRGRFIEFFAGEGFE